MFKVIAEQFAELSEKYGMKSMNMMEVANLAKNYASRNNSIDGV